MASFLSAHSTPSLLPSTYASQAAYSSFYAVRPEPPHSHVGDSPDPVVQAEEDAQHEAMEAIVPRGNATKIYAADSGNWSTAANWYPSGVPGAGDNIVIGESVVVTYDVNDPTTRLGTVRVDGTLTFRADINTAINYDTLIVMKSGFYNKGTLANPIAAGVTARSIHGDNGPIIVGDLDPWMMSRGTMWHGTTSIFGAAKTPFGFASSGLAAASTSITLVSAPSGWRVGDKIVIGGNQNYGLAYNNGPHNTVYHGRLCEKVTITSVSGTTVNFTPALAWSHVPPTVAYSAKPLQIMVQNLTRNITFESELVQDEGNGATPSGGLVSYLPQEALGDGKGNQRPHTMFMHTATFTCQYTEFANLGRTSKLFSRQGICYKNSVSAGGNAVLDGPYTTAGVASSDTLFQVVTQEDWTGASTLTITGTDAYGNAQTETSGVGVTYFSGLKLFKTVTSVSSSAAITNLWLAVQARTMLMTSNGVRKFALDGLSYTFDVLTNKHNLQGRYPLHIHKSGLFNYGTAPAIIGCSVHGSPGWGITHHGAHAHIIDCVVHDVYGAGMVGEAGNETGLWDNNMVVGMRSGDGTLDGKNGTPTKDAGRGAQAFWLTGRALKMNNMYVSDAGAGMVISARTQLNQMTSDQFEIPEVLRGRTLTDVDDHPISHFKNLVAVACEFPLEVIKANQAQGHDLRTLIDGVFGWSVLSGTGITYTSHYTNKDFVSIGGYQDPWRTTIGPATKGSVGSNTGTNSSDQSFINMYNESFELGFDWHHHNTSPTFVSSALNGRLLVDPIFASCDTNYLPTSDAGNDYGGYDSAIDVILTAGSLGSTVSLALDVARPVALAGGAFVPVTGTKTDEARVYSYPFGQELEIGGFGMYANDFSTLLAAKGYWTNTPDNKKYVMVPEMYSSTVTGAPYMKIIPWEVSASEWGSNFTSAVNNGNINLDLTTPPVMADFTVNLSLGTPSQVVPVVSRAAHAGGIAMYVAGHQSPMHTYIKNNNDGTLTFYPTPQFIGTETCTVFVADRNGHSIRNTITIVTSA